MTGLGVQCMETIKWIWNVVKHLVSAAIPKFKISVCEEVYGKHLWVIDIERARYIYKDGKYEWHNFYECSRCGLRE